MEIVCRMLADPSGAAPTEFCFREESERLKRVKTIANTVQCHANSFRQWGNHTRQHVFIEISASAPKLCWVTGMNHLQLLVLSKSRMNKVTFWTKIGHKNTVIESYLSWTTQMDNILKFPLTSRVKAGPFSAGLLWFVVAPSVQQFTSEINRKLVENLPFCDAYCPHESLLGFCVGGRLKFISVADWHKHFKLRRTHFESAGSQNGCSIVPCAR